METKTVKKTVQQKCRADEKLICNRKTAGC